MPDAIADVLIVGAGPAGLATALEAERRGLAARVLEQGLLVDAIDRFPIGMVFFTTRELLEIGDVPMTTASAKPTREEALVYYRDVAWRAGLDVRQHERVTAIEGRDGAFVLRTRTRFGEERLHRGRKVVVATGYFDHPNRMDLPGEDLPHVAHWFREPHDGAGSDVVVIGGGNSAAEAALELFRAGARVTLVVRRADLDPSIKYWVLPDLRNRIAEGRIQALFSTRVVAIRPHWVAVESAAGTRRELAAERVYALTGYVPDVDFLRAAGITVDPATLEPALDGATLETNVPGVHLAGSVTAGRRTNLVFIENGRFHAGQVVAAIAAALRPPGA